MDTGTHDITSEGREQFSTDPCILADHHHPIDQSLVTAFAPADAPAPAAGVRRLVGVAG